jgi:hypothetical protein
MHGTDLGGLKWPHLAFFEGESCANYLILPSPLSHFAWILGVGNPKVFYHLASAQVKFMN